MIMELTVAGVLLNTAIVIMLSGLRIVNQYQRGVKFTLGRYSGILGPGPHLIIPLAQWVKKVDIRQTTLTLKKQEVMSKDQVNINIDGVVFYHISDPAQSIMNVENLEKQIGEKAASELKEIVGKLTMTEALQGRAKIAQELQEHMTEAITDNDTGKPWGVIIKSIQINNIELPEVLTRAMAKEAEAEREKKAIVIRADGENEAAGKYNEASRKYNKLSLRLRELKTYEEIGKEHNTLMMVIPTEMMDLFRRK